MAGLHWHLSHGFSPLSVSWLLHLSTRQQLGAGPLSALKGFCKALKGQQVPWFFLRIQPPKCTQTFAPSPLPVPQGTRALHGAPKALHDLVNIWARDRGERQQRKPLQKPGWRSRIPEVSTNEVLAPTCLWRSAGPFLLLLALKNKTKRNKKKKHTPPKKLMSKLQLGKLQPIQLILPGVPAAPGRCRSGSVGTGRSGIGMAGCIPSLFSATSTTHIIQQRKSKAKSPSTAHAHTHPA